jgi:hypothetical protein
LGGTKVGEDAGDAEGAKVCRVRVEDGRGHVGFRWIRLSFLS